MMKLHITKSVCFLMISSVFVGGCTPSRHSTPQDSQQTLPTQESVPIDDSKIRPPDLSPLVVDFYNEEVDVFQENNWSIEYAIKSSREVEVKKKNLPSQTEDTIFSYSEYWPDDFSLFVPPSIALSPCRDRYLYSTDTQFLLWTKSIDDTICLASTVEKEISSDTTPSDSQSWQYHYSTQYSSPIWGVYAPRYPKWSFDGRYCSIDVPIYREGSGSFVYDLQKMDTVSIGNEIHPFIGSGIDIQWSPVANQFVSSTASTGWNDRQFVISDLDNGALKDLTEILPQNFEETYDAIFSPDGTRIAFLGITSSSSHDYQPTLYELDLQSHTLTKVYTLFNNHYSNSFPFFYSPDGRVLYYTTRLENSWTLSKFDLETKAIEEIAIWTSPETSYETHLVDTFWYKDTVFLTFYLEKNRQSEPPSSNLEIQSQFFGIQPDQRKLYYRSKMFQGKVKLLDIQPN